MRSGIFGCALLLLAAVGAGASRLVLPGSTLSTAGAAAQSPAVAVEHSNNRPLIGILAQACHNCPGRSVFLLGRIISRCWGKVGLIWCA